METLLDKPTPQPAPIARPSLAGLGREGLKAALGAIGVPEKQVSMRAGQLWSWIYVRGATSFEAMSDVSKELRARLAAAYSLDGRRSSPSRCPSTARASGCCGCRAADTRRGRRRSRRSTFPEADRGTLCISSQVGCTLTCSFCHTGTQRLVRNLEAAEIVGQILLARDRIGDWPGAAAPGRRRSHP